MKVGAKWELYIHAELGYGERGAGRRVGPNETLIFEVELVSIEPPTKPKPQKIPQKDITTQKETAPKKE